MPGRGTGVRELVTPMAKEALACGADGILVEVHCDPPNALRRAAVAFSGTVRGDDARAPADCHGRWEGAVTPEGFSGSD
jgi:hypothetical protein